MNHVNHLVNKLTRFIDSKEHIQKRGSRNASLSQSLHLTHPPAYSTSTPIVLQHETHWNLIDSDNKIILARHIIAFAAAIRPPGNRRGGATVRRCRWPDGGCWSACSKLASRCSGGRTRPLPIILPASSRCAGQGCGGIRPGYGSPGLRPTIQQIGCGSVPLRCSYRAGNRSQFGPLLGLGGLIAVCHEVLGEATDAAFE